MDASEELITYFYKDPRPERLAGFIEQYERLPASQSWQAYPPLVGFLAAIFKAHPDRIERLLPIKFSPRSAVAVAAALNLSGNGARVAGLQSKLDRAGSDEMLRSELAGLPAQLEDLSLQTASHLDIMWGAAFATGDDRFVLKIVDFFARTADRSEQIAIDVMKTVHALTGGPKEILTELRGRYGDARAMEIVFAATALWALQSNAPQHPLVQRAVEKYCSDHAGAPAAKSLSALLHSKGK